MTRLWRTLAVIWAGAVVVALGLLALGLFRFGVRGEGLPNTRGWGEVGSPGSAEGRTFAAGNIVQMRAGGVRVRVHRLAAANFRGFLNELAAKPYAIRQRDTGAYNHRVNVNDPTRLSEHSWGTAVDVNWTANPNRSDCRLITDLPGDIAALAKRWGLRWGGAFHCPKDPMHFEVKGTPEDARTAARLASRTTRP